jgi:hypothetical protein
MLHQQGLQPALDQAKARGYIGLNDKAQGSTEQFEEWKKQTNQTKKLEFQSTMLS